MVINEVAWAGTAASATDEWFELYNAGDSVIDLTGWTLNGFGLQGEVKEIGLSGSIAPGAYFLVERTDDTTVSDIPGDVVGSFSGSGFNNSCETVTLRDGGGFAVDSVPCGENGWFGGDNASKRTMERINPLLSGSDPSNWGANNGEVVDGVPVGGTMVGRDASGNPIFGTPRHKNSISP